MNPADQNISNSLGYDHTTYVQKELIDYESLMLFVEEIIDYSLRKNDILNWKPPMNMEYLRIRHSDEKYFDEVIGKAVCHYCTEAAACVHAEKFGFNEALWFTLKPDEAREALINFLEKIIGNSIVSMNFTAFKVFSLGCYLGRRAFEKGQKELTNEVVHALVHTCCSHFLRKDTYIEYLRFANPYISNLVLTSMENPDKSKSK